MKVRFYLDKSTKNEAKTIWCYIREFDDTLTLNTGERIKIDFWDSVKQRANLRKPKDTVTKGALKSLNQYLNAFENKVYEVARNIRSKDFDAGFSTVAEALRRQFDKREENFFTVYDEFLKLKKVKVSADAHQKYNRAKDLLLEFDKKITFEKVTPLFLDKFYLFLIEHGMINNSAHKTMQFFKTFMIWANTNGYTDNTSYKTFKSTSEENEVVFLSEEELMSLYNMKIENERLDRVRDLFVYQCLTGVRYSDIQNIQHSDIDGATWKVRTQKTRQILEIPLSNLALSILAKYKEFPQPLPIISNQKQNKYIKELCELAEIDALVTTVKYKGSNRVETTVKKYKIIGTHTARRTFISLSLQKGMKADVIMAITGHTTYKMMQKYLKIADEHKRDEMDKVWGNTLRKIK